MRVYLDDAELPGPISTLADALDAARRHAASLGRIIVEASADALPIPDDTLADPESVDRQPESVQFVSADPLAMVRGALLDAAAVLESARDEHASVVAAIDGAQVEQVGGRLERILGAWTACIATIRDGGALVGIDLASPVAGGPAPAARVAELSATLIEVKRCLAAQDWSGLSDAVGEDLERHARDWDGMLRTLAGSLGKEG
jgi:hypothetical protein